MTRTLSLVGGIVSSLLYVAMTAGIALQWKDYSSASQTISELSAIGAPTRSVSVAFAALYTLLVTGFGWVVWQSAGRGRALRVAGGAIVVYGGLGLLWPFAPMHLRETLAAGGGTLSDTLHLVLAGMTVMLMLLAMAAAAVAFGARFRLYSIASLAILGVFGALTFLDAPGIAANLPTPWIGVWERVNVGVFLLWIVVLAIDPSPPSRCRCRPRHLGPARRLTNPRPGCGIVRARVTFPAPTRSSRCAYRPQVDGRHRTAACTAIVVSPISRGAMPRTESPPRPPDHPQHNAEAIVGSGKPHHEILRVAGERASISSCSAFTAGIRSTG